MISEHITPAAPGNAQPSNDQGSNLSSLVRKLFFVLCIAFFIVVILYLVYQNGKSIYDNGI